MEAVREAVAQEAVIGLHAVRPVVGQREPVSAVHLELGAPRVSRPDLEARGVDQAVHFVLDAVHDHRVLGHALDTPSPWSLTSFTLGRLNVGRYSSLKVGRLHHCPYHGLSASAVSELLTVEDTRSRISFIFW